VQSGASIENAMVRTATTPRIPVSFLVILIKVARPLVETL
jgi:hypothetical protein